MPAPLRVVVAHDYLTQRGGAERVALALLTAFPGARMVTSCYHPDTTYPGFADHDITTLWPDRFGWMRRDPRRALPVLAQAFSSYVVEDADVVICSSSGWSHGIGGDVPRVVYCHNPARWLHQPDEYFPGIPRWARRAVTGLGRPLARWDARAAARVETYVANSHSVAARIRSTYGLAATVVWPPRGVSADGPQTPIPGLAPGFLLTVGRPRGYKNTQVVCEAVAGLPTERLVVVGGPPAGTWPQRIVGLVDVTDAQMRWLYANCVGLVGVAHEDFGLTPVEAQAFGKPSVVLRGGGYLDSTVEGVTGLFVDAPHRELVRDAIRELRLNSWDADAIRTLGERYALGPFGSAMHVLAEQAARAGSARQSDAAAQSLG